MDNMESLNKQEISFLKEQITRLEATMATGFATLTAKIELMTDGYVRREDFNKEIDKLVTKDSFRPVRAIAYTIVFTIGIAVLGALIKLIIL